MLPVAADPWPGRPNLLLTRRTRLTAVPDRPKIEPIGAAAPAAALPGPLPVWEILRVRPTSSLIALVVPGAVLFWVFLVMGVAQGRQGLVTAALVIGGLTALVAVSVAGRRGAAARRERERILAEGRRAEARIVSARADGAVRSDPYVAMVLDVRLPGDDDSYRVEHRVLVPHLNVHRIRREAVVDVWVDPEDREVVVLDPEITGRR